MKTTFASLVVYAAFLFSSSSTFGYKTSVSETSVDFKDLHLNDPTQSDALNDQVATVEATDTSERTGTLGDSIVAATENVSSMEPTAAVTLSPELKKLSGIENGAITTPPNESIKQSIKEGFDNSNGGVIDSNVPSGLKEDQETTGESTTTKESETAEKSETTDESGTTQSGGDKAAVEPTSALKDTHVNPVPSDGVESTETMTASSPSPQLTPCVLPMKDRQSGNDGPQQSDAPAPMLPGKNPYWQGAWGDNAQGSNQNSYWKSETQAQTQSTTLTVAFDSLQDTSALSVNTESRSIADIPAMLSPSKPLKCKVRY